MEHLFVELLNLCVDYKWVIVAALVVSALLNQPQGVSEAIDAFDPKNTHGNGGWADKAALRMAGLFKGKGIPIGYTEDGRELHYSGIGHLLSVAAARTGKGVLLISALLSWASGAIIIDPKSENALVTAKRRRHFGPVYILSPFKNYADELGSMFARYNPMDILSAGLSFHADTDMLAAALVWEEKGGENKFFTDGARILVSGIIASQKRHAPKDRQNLLEVARIISSGDGLFTYCREVVAATKDEFIKAKLERFALPEGAEPTKGLVEVIGTAIGNLGFLNNAAIAEAVSGSSFRFGDVRKHKATVFICLPLSKLDITSKYFRLVLESALAELLNERIKWMKRERVLVVVDEAFMLGNDMKILENCMGMGAGAAGIQLWLLYQDISQIRGQFRDTWETLIQNCGITLWWGCRDQSTRTYVSGLAGTYEVISRSASASVDRQTGEVMVSESGSQYSRPVVHPHEVGAMTDDKVHMIAFVEGVKGPLLCKRRPYWLVSKFRGQFRKNPYAGNMGGGLVEGLLRLLK